MKQPKGKTIGNIIHQPLKFKSCKRRIIKKLSGKNNIIKIKEATKISKIGITSICDKTFKSFTFSPKIAIDNALAKPNKVIIPIKANDMTIKKII